MFQVKKTIQIYTNDKKQVTGEKLIKPCDRQQARENIALVKSARKNVTNETSGKKLCYKLTL